ncbi:FecCD family ABC transporter permease [Oceanospirillum linum]|uniref:Ferrichrome ABC transporter permease n=1 Tax=Oceanospirillum linum TaxID=966 RepID=A0A1T1H9M6_OCELI|nr:iron ABC transporter permease [Oceanospirillum linum]OOV86430.1 ferrichrome ABC transporter permease [Oceanospirillum linum]SEG33184.1 iron complex transport system permease protein [Oleiphilus messinensis]SMP29200.1 iron complex transport system permease protein [Oceanospirillum linum]
MRLNIHRYKVIYGLLILAIASGLVCSLIYGAATLSLDQVVHAMFSQGGEHSDRVVWNMRLPRAVLACLVGLHFALSGLILQTLTRNPLADAGIMGINAGAGLAAISVVVGAALLPFGSGIYSQGGQVLTWLPIAALTGGCITAILVYLVSGAGQMTPLRLILTGVIFAAVFNALATGLLALWGQAHTETVVAWLAGSLHGRNWLHLWILLPWTVLGLIGVVFCLRPLELIRLHDDQVQCLGVNIRFWRLVVVLLATLLASSAVAVAGPIGFVGLIVPHIARKIAPVSFKQQLMLTGGIGALLVMTADLVGRVSVAPFELPVGILCALLGVPAFLYLLRKNP